MKMPFPAGVDRPFSSVPVYERYLAIGSIEEARSRICRMIERGEGLGIVVGPPGTGKTLLCQRIAAQFRSSHATVMLGDVRVTSRTGLLQQVLLNLGQSYQGMEESEMQLRLVECLTQGSSGGRSLLLVIDEAQLLSTELLEEIRMLTNLIRDGRQLVQSILVGGPKLEDPLADPQMESLSQRIVARCYLHPMTQAESSQYIRSLLAVTGLKIDDDAIAAVHHACGGIPRLVNQLMNQSLDFATQQRKRVIDESCVQNAWADLQQLPSPVVEPRMKPLQSSIEFGELDDSPMNSASKPAHCESDSPVKSCTGVSSEAAFGEYEAVTQSSSAHYVDFESILASKSIVCLSDSAMAPESAPESAVVTTITAQVKKADRKAYRDELFGIDFSDEMLVDIRLADALAKPVKPAREAMPGSRPSSMPATMSATMSRSIDPAAEEISLHSEILKMSQNAKTASDTRSTIRAALPWAPLSYITEESIDEIPLDSVEVPKQMAVVWNDEPLEGSIDDRDMLVIEDDVTILVDQPASSMIGSGTMRQPTAPVEQHYQNLFSRLRTGQ